MSFLPTFFATAGLLSISTSAALGKPGAKKGAGFTLTTSAFHNQGEIPVQYTGDGKNMSPPLQWTGEPRNTRAFALLVDDPDAPSPQPWVHWVIYDIPADVHQLPEGVPTQAELDQPPGAEQGMNSRHTIGYEGPQPPKGHGWHHYHFKLYALDRKLALQPGASKEQLLEAMKNHVLAETEIVGRFAH